MAPIYVLLENYMQELNFVELAMVSGGLTAEQIYAAWQKEEEIRLRNFYSRQ